MNNSDNETEEERSSNSRTNQKTCEKDDEIKRLHFTIQNMKKEHNATRKKYLDELDVNEDLQQKIKKLEKKLICRRKDSSSSDSDLDPKLAAGKKQIFKKTVGDYKKEISILEKLVSGRDKDVRKLQEDLQNYQKMMEHKELNSKNATKEEKYSKQIREKDTDSTNKVRIKDLEKDLESKSSDLRAKDKILKEYTHKVDDLEGQVERLTAILNIKEKEIRTLKEKLRKNEYFLNKKHGDLMGRDEALENIKKKLDEQIKLAGDLNTKLAVAVIERKEYEEQYKKECRLNEELLAKNKDLQNKLPTNTTNMEEYKKKMLRLQITEFINPGMTECSGKGQTNKENYAIAENNDICAPWWERQMKPENKQKVQCPICNQEIWSTDVYDHIERVHERRN